MIFLLCLHIVAAICAPLAVQRWGRRTFWALAVPPAATAVWALAHTPVADGGAPSHEVLPWVPVLGLDLAFRLDGLSWLMSLVVGGIGALVLIYCAGYFKDSEEGLGRFAGCLVGFAGAMLGLVTSDDLLLLYVFWEITTVLSYLLIGHAERSRASRAAATQALVVTAFGGLAMLAGIVIIGQRAGTYRLSEIVSAPLPTDDLLVGVAALLLLLGAFTKSALIPFHFWLPGAMAAPTPVSAYLHAAAMVKAGIYIVARLAPAFAELPTWRFSVLVAGGLTMLLGAYRALRQHDLKLLLAFGTVSQLGFLVVLLGTGTRQAALAGLTMLAAHALYKGCLFLTVGAIDHATGTRDLRQLSGIRARMPVLAVAATLAAASMAGLPPLLGFVGKEAVYATYLGSEAPWSTAVLAVLVTGSALTVAYSARFVWGAFRTQEDHEPTGVHAPGPILVGVPALLSAAGLVAGFTSLTIEPFLGRYADALRPDGPAVHLGLWHGFGIPLALSALTIALGAVLTLRRRAVNAVQARIATAHGSIGADDAYRRLISRLDRDSVRITSVLQRGSLPLSLALILGVFVVLVGGSLLITGARPGEVRLADSSAQLAAVLLTCYAAVAAVRSRRRFRAVFLVGATGYGCAVLFLFFGAPDLALTQALAESLSLLVFVLVLRRLPSRFDDEGAQRRMIRLCFGVACGLLVTVLALVLPGARSGPPASAGMAEAAVAFGGGNNIVNVILVDIRAWDTMGELSVVIAAATGIGALIFLDEKALDRGRHMFAKVRERRRHWGTTPTPATAGRWIAETTMRPRQRSLILEVVVRLIFHSVLVWSVFLLFTGHNAPGGGFAAGLVAGLAIAMRYLAGGRAELNAALPVPPGYLLGAGLFLSAGNALASMIAGGAPLQTWIFDVPVPLLGDVHLVTSVFFDIGVYLVVIGLVLDVMRSLGGGIEDHGERAGNPDDPDAPSPAPELPSTLSAGEHAEVST